MIAAPAENALSLPIHASIDGVVTAVTEHDITIQAKK